jgi:putative ABC transport system permease protein
MGKLIDIVLLAFHSLRVHIVRSILTMIGIIFGVCSVSIMLAINAGAGKQSADLLRELGSNSIIFSSVKPSAGNSSTASKGFSLYQYGIKHTTVSCLVNNIQDIDCYTTLHIGKQFYYAREDKQSMATVFGVEPKYADVANPVIVQGRFISNMDMEQRNPYCVITSTLARNAFKCENPIGKIIRLKDRPFKVVGVMKRLPKTLEDTNISESDIPIFIPRTTEESMFSKMNVMSSQGNTVSEKVEVNQLIIKMKNEQAVMDAAPIARRIIDKQQPKNDCSIKIPKELIEKRAAQRKLWDLLSFVIASVSLIVGGIGIMNIMLASVTERTKEIGVRRAIGAKKRDIIIQFLLEAITMTTCGGLIGVALGYFTPPYVGDYLNIVPIISMSMLILPFFMAIGVGIVSGLYPAIRAAGLDPIEALRHE